MFDDANVAVPNFIVENEEIGHAHYGYALEVLVRPADGPDELHKITLKLLRAGMTRRLNADPNFKFGLYPKIRFIRIRTTWLR